MKFVEDHILWFVAAALFLYLGNGNTGAPTFKTSSTFEPGGSGKAGGGATGSW